MGVVALSEAHISAPPFVICWNGAITNSIVDSIAAELCRPSFDSGLVIARSVKANLWTKMCGEQSLPKDSSSNLVNAKEILTFISLLYYNYNMKEITPNHLLTLCDIVGLMLVEGNEHIPGCITKKEIADIAEREGYPKIRFLNEEPSMITADVVGDRTRIFLDKTGIILDVYSG